MKFTQWSRNLNKQVNQFEYQCKTNEEIIKRFDEVILDKASKISLKELEQYNIDFQAEHK